MRNKKRFNRPNNRNNDRKFFKNNNSSNNNNNNNANNNKSKNFNDMIKFVSTNISKKDDSLNNKSENNKNENRKILKLFNLPGKNENKNQNQNQNRQPNRNNINNKYGRHNKNIKPINHNHKNRIYAYKVNTFNKEDCAICSKKIIDMSNSIKDEENNKYYHFDCLMKEIENKNNIALKPMQRMAYLGSSTFGIVEDYKENGRNKFKIIQKFNYFAKDVL